MAELFTPAALVALLTLTVLEVVLGVDNIIFLAIVTQGVPKEQQAWVRRLGLTLAWMGRIAMILGMSWLLGLQETLFSAIGHDFSAKDLILLAGGLFLSYKAVTEIYKTTECKEECAPKMVKASAGTVAGVVFQIMVVDMVFAIDSVLTAVGLTQMYAIIIIAMTIAIISMMFFAGTLAEFIEQHPSLKMLALAFLVLVGVLLIADGFGEEIERTYVYFAIMFSMAVEALNFRRSKNLTRQQETMGPTGV